MTPSGLLGLHTDLYEIRMVETYLRLGMTRPATFSLFARPSPERPFYVVSGLDLALDVLDAFAFGPEEIDYLAGQDVPDFTLQWLRDLEPAGEMWAARPGTVLLADEPWLEMTAPLPVAQLLETSFMNALHYDTLVATQAARLVRAAEGRPVVDFGFRRAHGLESGLRAARAAWIGGASATSNVEAGRRFGIPVAGTMAHSFVQAFPDETSAFEQFLADHESTTLLVDTYDTERGVDRAIRATKTLRTRGRDVSALRIDSEPLLEMGLRARRALDEAGLSGVGLFASGGLDEEGVAALVRKGAPYDGFGVGSALVCGKDKPALDVAYKLVEYAGKGRAKLSRGKATLPGAKQVFRRGPLADDVLEARTGRAGGRPLLERVWKDGRRLFEPDPAEARRRAAEVLDRLPRRWFELPGPDPPPQPKIGPGLARAWDEIRARYAHDGT